MSDAINVDLAEAICVNCPVLGIKTWEYSGFESQLNRRNKLNLLNINLLR